MKIGTIVENLMVGKDSAARYSIYMGKRGLTVMTMTRGGGFICNYEYFENIFKEYFREVGHSNFLDVVEEDLARARKEGDKE